MHQRIITLFTNDQPVPFLTLIITADPDGIVRTLLYLLQLVNRKKVELWQKIPDTDEATTNSALEVDTGLDIFVTPTSTTESSKHPRKTPQINAKTHLQKSGESVRIPNK